MQRNTGSNHMEHHGTMQHIRRRSVHQNVTRRGNQTVTEPSIMCPFSIIELTGPILIVSTHQAARYSQVEKRTLCHYSLAGANPKKGDRVLRPGKCMGHCGRA